jgi:hypothetical protein
VPADPLPRSAFSAILDDPMSTEPTAASPGQHLSHAEQTLIQRAVEAGARRYFEQRRARIPGFVQDNFSFRGALRINRLALGGDLWRAPANLMWAVPYLSLRVAAYGLRRLGAQRVSRSLTRLPPGFRTRVQQEVEWRVHTELLEQPYRQADRASDKDALLEAVLAQEDLSRLLLDYMAAIDSHRGSERFRVALERELKSYGGTRVAVADLACGMISVSAGAAAFKQLTPGALSTGSVLAGAIAQHSAISGFVFGPTLGSVYYSAFPAAASAGLVAASTTGVLAALGVVSAVSGVITDPMQAQLGLHQRRLRKLVDGLERQFHADTAEGLNPKEHFVARVFDLADLLKTAASIAR